MCSQGAMLDIDPLDSIDAIERIGTPDAVDALLEIASRRTGVVAERAKQRAGRLRYGIK